MTRMEAVTRQGPLRIDTHGIARNERILERIGRLRLDILDHGIFRGDLAWNRLGVVSPFSRLYFMEAHSGWLDTPSGRVDLVPGFMYLVPAYLRVDLRTEHRIEKLYLHFLARFDGLDLFEGMDECLVLPMPDGFRDRLREAMTRGDVTDLLAFQGLACEAVSRFAGLRLPEIEARLRLADRYRDVHAYVETHLRASLAAREVADALGRPCASLERSYRQDTGVTLNRYIHAQLTRRAGTLLLRTSRPVRDIAEALGFADEFYFSRFFKKRMEYSPREYRRVNGNHGES